MNVHILILINKTVASMTICILLLVGTTAPQSLVFYSILTTFPDGYAFNAIEKKIFKNLDQH